MAKKKQNKPRTGAAPAKSASAARQPSWFAQHPVLAALGFFAVIIFVFFFETIFLGTTYLSPDAQAPAALTVQLRKALWEHGVFPQWMPYLFAGMPSFASLVYTPFAYLPSVVLEPLGRLIPFRAMLIFAMYYVMAGLGVFLFLRRKGAGFISAIFGGLTFMLMPYLITMTIFGHGSQLMTAAYIPLALWAVDRVLEKFSLLNLGAAGLIIGLMLQRAHVQIAYYGLMLLGLYLLHQIFVAVRRKETSRLLPMLGGFGGALALGFALSAMMYLPLQEYTPYSIRGSASVLNASENSKDAGVGFEYATQWSFSPGEMMTFFIPSFYGFGGMTYWGNMPFTDYPNYMGILVLGLALVALVRRVPGAGFFGLASLLALLISFGKNFASFYGLFYDFFPYFNKFRVPVMILILVQCSVAILAGMGLHSLLQSLAAVRNREKAAAGALLARRLWLGTAVLLGVALLLLLARGPFQEFMAGIYPDQYEAGMQTQLDAMRFEKLMADILIVAFIASAGLAMIALAFSKKISPGFAAGMIVLLTLIDLWIVDKKIGEGPVPERNMEAYLAPDAVARFLAADTTVHRIYPTADLFNELRWTAQGIESVGGYHAAKPRRYQDFIEATDLPNRLLNDYFQPAEQGGRRGWLPRPLEAVPMERRLANQRLLDLLNVKYILSSFPLQEPAWAFRTAETIGVEGSARQVLIYENQTVLPRAFLVGDYEHVSEDLATLTRLRAGDFDPRRTVLLAEQPESEPAPDSTAIAVVTKLGLQEIIIATESQSPQILVLSDNFYPICWRAEIDGKPVKTLRANYAFRGVEVPAGKHRLEFRYQSRAFTLGVIISLSALALTLGLIFMGRRQIKKE